MRILFLFNMLLCFVASVFAQEAHGLSICDVYEDNNLWTENKLTIAKYIGPDGNELNYGLFPGLNEVIVLPPKGKVEKRKWHSLYEYHYNSLYNENNHYEYETISIPEQIICEGKKYTVTAIHQDAIGRSCKKMVIPKSIKSFGQFYGCFKNPDMEIHVSDLNSFFSASNSDVCLNQTLYLNGKVVTDYTIPPTRKKIRSMAFYSNRSLKSLVISGNVIIDKEAFKRCSDLTSITISDNVNIGEETFRDCIGLTSISISDNVTISKYALTNCNNLEEVEINTKIIPSCVFNNHNKLKKVIIGPNVKFISYDAFSNCKSLACVIIKDNPRLKIYSGAFKNCSKLFDIQGLTMHTEVVESAFENSGFSFVDYKKKFSFYATSRLTDAIEEWQKKGEFETTAQWQQRVTKNNRDAKVTEITEKLKQEFIANGKSAEPTAEIQEYDADKSVFVVKIGQEEFYVKVPNDEAKQFKANFNPKGMQTKYDIANDVLKIVDVSYKYNGKVYPTTNNYSKADNLDYLALNLPPLEVNFGNGTSTTTKQNIPTDLTIDKNIPTTNIKNDHTFAVIIGNENYKSVSKVQYAQNDARSFAEYCKKTLGLPEKNVRGYEDATYGMMVSALQDIKKIANAYHGDINVIFYYAGHGIPDNSSKNASLLPIDADGRQMDICLSLNKLYQDLGALEAKSVTVFLDACFSGALRGDGMLMAARGVAIKPKTSAPQGKMVIFSAATDEQTAFPYTEKGHGMFTYYLLKKIRDTNGDCTLGELGSYICNEVAKQSIVTNGREQTPSVSTSTSIVDSWKNLKLK